MSKCLLPGRLGRKQGPCRCMRRSGLGLCLRTRGVHTSPWGLLRGREGPGCSPHRGSRPTISPDPSFTCSILSYPSDVFPTIFLGLFFFLLCKSISCCVSSPGTFCFFNWGKIHIKSNHFREFPGGPVARTPCSHCQSPGSVPAWGTRILQARGAPPPHPRK